MVEVSKWSLQRDWENPTIYERNRGRMHVPLRSYKSREAALVYFTEGPKLVPRERISCLNSETGEWKFKLFDRPDDVSKEFWTTKFDDAQWARVRFIVTL